MLTLAEEQILICAAKEGGYQASPYDEIMLRLADCELFKTPSPDQIGWWPLTRKGKWAAAFLWTERVTSVGWLNPEGVVMKSDQYVTSDDSKPLAARKLVQLTLDKIKHIKGDYELGNTEIAGAAAYHLLNDAETIMNMALKALEGNHHG